MTQIVTTTMKIQEIHKDIITVKQLLQEDMKIVQGTIIIAIITIITQETTYLHADMKTEIITTLQEVTKTAPQEGIIIQEAAEIREVQEAEEVIEALTADNIKYLYKLLKKI